MTKWEYLGLLLSTTFRGDNIDKMNELGQDGWELVVVYEGIAHMKRPISEGN